MANVLPAGRWHPFTVNKAFGFADFDIGDRGGNGGRHCNLVDLNFAGREKESELHELYRISDQTWLSIEPVDLPLA